MARYKLQGTATDGMGRAIPGALASIYLAGTSTVANAYENVAGGAHVHADISDDAGYWSFFIDEAEYDVAQRFKIVLTKEGYRTQEFDYIVVFPGSGSGDGGVQAALIVSVLPASPTSGTWQFSFVGDDSAGELWFQTANFSVKLFDLP